MASRHEDYYLWLQRKSTQYQDDDEMFDYIMAMSNREQSGIKSQIRRIMVHLIKYMCQPDRRTKSWSMSVDQAYDEIAEYFDGSPSLIHFINEEPMPSLYRQARSKAITEMRVNNYVTPPQSCPWTIDQLLDQDQVLDLILEYIDHKPLY